MESKVSDICSFLMEKMVPLNARNWHDVTASLIELVVSYNVRCGLASRPSGVTIYHQCGHFQ